jgi:general stress protein 26
MNEMGVRAAATELVEASLIASVGTLDETGAPRVVAMIVAEKEGLRRLWFSTNTSSEHVAQLERDSRASVYFAQWVESPWRGLTLGGRMEILRDRASRERLWEDGCERYYPKGVDDPDYAVLRFTAEWGKFYQYGTKMRFEIEKGG